MRYPKDQRAQTRQKILEASARVFRSQGYRGTTIDEVMTEAGLTVGAFYKHFESKESLLEAALSEALADNSGIRERGLEDLTGTEWVEGLVRRYLSPQHREHVELGCPFPALVTDMGRHPGTQKIAQRGLESLRDRIADQLEDLPGQDREHRALGMIAAMVGGLALSRAVPKRLAKEILEGATQSALSLLESPDTAE